MQTKAFKPKLSEFNYRKGDREYSAWRVRFEDKDGRIKFRQFPSEQEAQDFADLELINAKNLEVRLSNVVTELTREQVLEAQDAIRRLGTAYTLTEAVDYFLRYHRRAEQELPLSEAVFRYIEKRETEGTVRARTLRQIKSTLEIFKAYFPGNPNISSIGTPDVVAFLKSLKAKDGETPASPKTWNNVQSELNQFFSYCGEAGGEDRHEPSREKTRWIMLNPCDRVKRHNLRDINSGTPEILTAKQASALMQHVATFKDGALVPYFALALFAGIRTGDEIVKLANHPNRAGLMNFQTRKIHITAEISKTRHGRKITMPPVLIKWLKAFPVEILPTNADRDIKKIRKTFKIGHDVMRHTFISHHVAKFGSIGRTALEAGNTEHIIKTHYLDLVSKAQGQAFFKIEPPVSEDKVLDFQQASGE